MAINGISSSQYTYNLLGKGLDATSERGKAISNNIANVNTKGYKRYYVNFEDNLKSSMDNLAMERTDSRHINDGASFGDIQLKKDTASSVNEDGNNVDVDSEMSNEAQNTLEYYTLINQISSRISMERSVINGR
ncbi:flagellar basal body rod protein FlgB [Clostridium felsineum]|uniref:Flagellar basal body rod protein FlgB n=1 Tax=Clostridium felsineum TaxID=36839 RepID=A0A1S8L0G2_9CLOT|nr:flagellar basal body rod protein FlgB [Clostridium felsineum]MCR3757820.1 flagellar basal body rod protein FlgB [Clostridium felsineum]URZ06328.1 Flagellar basal body rod protein FlgB [Clostridium felsineum]URZ11363.1 Flagellar basal body rod protein FlgB [Clostridium felsineum]URZ16024.1 Flagellar basal body rod protein FlgB [Clostridium felsineum DSM 794]